IERLRRSSAEATGSLSDLRPFRAMFRCQPGAVAAVDSDGCITVCNESATAMLGRGASSLQRRYVSSLDLSILGADIEEVLLRIAASGGTFREVRNVRGEPCLVEIYGFSGEDGRGAILRALVV
ncbi:unnamed protein product, partial [marine sediment metagenome]